MIDFNQVPAVRPIDRGEAVAPEVERRDLRGLPLAGILRVFNHLLHQQQWARERLAVHGGKSLRIGVDPQFVLAPLTPNLFARITQQGLLERCEPVQTDVALWLMPSIDALFAGLRAGPKGLSPHLRIDGDVLLAGVLGDLAQHLRWDVEEDLSKVVGDIGANRLARGFAALRDQAAENSRRIESSVAAWLTIEQSVLLDRVSFDDWRAELAQLERRIDSLKFAAPK